MTPMESERDLERFRSAVSRLLGLHFDETRLASLSEALERRVEANREPRSAYLERIEGGNPPHEEVRALAQELTVGETYFFRNMEQFRAFAEIARPLSRMRVLSAGCATGEEPYSLAMIAQDLVEQGVGGTVSITGVDVNPAALAKASRGIYSHWALRETPGDIKRRWFADRGSDHVVAPSIRAMVRFEERNLADEEPGLWQPGSYDVVFCRNVLMYLTPDRARALVARIGAALAPGGHLFLGSAETLRGLSHGFHLRHTHGTFYYQRRDGEPGQDEAVLVGRGGEASVVAASEEVWKEGWVETVRRSSARIHELSERSRGSPVPGLGPPRVVAAADVARAMDLLKNERFADALRALGDAPEDLPSDPDVLLLRAVLLTLSGRLDDAETACNHLCQLDDLSAGAHYLLALCREGAGDPEGAAEHDRAAAYLDPAFAMPRLHLGLLARRAGDARSARREIEQALDLLVREDPSRILLFGGGFTREALAQLCRAELRAIGDPR